MEIKQIIIAAAILAACFLLGTLILDLLKLKKTVCRALTAGALTALALFQAIAYPLYCLNASFRLLYALYLPVMGALLLLALVRLVVRRESGTYLANFRKVRTLSWPQIALMLLLLAAVAMQLLIAVRYTFASTDDSFYISRAMETVAQNRLDITHAEGWLGHPSEAYTENPDASTWVFLQAVLAELTGTHVAVLCHGALLLALTLLSCAAVWSLADRLSEKLRRPLTVKLLTLLFATVLLILHAAYLDTSAFWTQRFIWHGKTLLPALIFPCLLTGVLDVVEYGYEKKLPYGPWAFIAIVLTAGVCVSIVGLYLPLILYFTLGVSYLVITKGKPIRVILMPALFAALPVLIIGVVTLLRMRVNDTALRVDVVSMNWVEEFNHCFRFFRPSLRFFVLYVAGVVYLCFRRNKTAIILFVGAPAILFLTFLNPLFINIVAKYVTTSLVYWRLYWLLPLYFVPAFALADAIGRLSEQTAKGMLIGALCTALGFGTIAYCQFGAVWISEQVKAVLDLSLLEKRSNSYVLPDSTLAIAGLILADYGPREDRPVLLTATTELYGIRQYTRDIVLAVGMREAMWEMQTEAIPDTGMTASEFLLALSRGEISDLVLLRKGLDHFRANYFCLDQGKEALPEVEGLTYLTTIDGFDIWRYESAVR